MDGVLLVRPLGGVVIVPAVDSFGTEMKNLIKQILSLTCFVGFLQEEVTVCKSVHCKLKFTQRA